MGFPVDFELGRTMATFHESRRALIFEATKSLVVKMAGFDSQQQVITVLNGFFWHDSEPLILTSAHICKANPARISAYFSDGAQFTGHDVQLVKTGLPDQNNTNWFPDLAVFRCAAQPAHPPRPPSAVAATGNSAYIVGFAGLDAPQLSFNDGIVSCVAPDRFTVSAYAEPGFSGSPVLNIDGFLLGLVQGGHDAGGSKQVTVVPASVIDTWLRGTQPIVGGLITGYKTVP